MSTIAKTKADRPHALYTCLSCRKLIEHGEPIFYDTMTDGARHTRCTPLPTVHLNGTSSSSLVDQQRAIYDAATALIAALAEAAPNQRDYYPQGENAYLEARSAHDERMRQALRIRDDAMFTHGFLEDT